MIFEYMKIAVAGVKDAEHVIRIGAETAEELEEKRIGYIRAGWDNATEEEYNAQFEAIGDPDNIVPDEEAEETEPVEEEETGDAESVEEEVEETDTEEEDVPPPLATDEDYTD
jgi:hypothetical protein